LTALPNRRSLHERVGKALDRADKHGKLVALLYVDLDGFKDVNDRFGHSTGDRVRQNVAQRLLNTLRAVDTVCRLGGDEFAILLEDVPDRLHAERVATAVEAVLGTPFSNGETVPDRRHRRFEHVSGGCGRPCFIDGCRRSQYVRA